MIPKLDMQDAAVKRDRSRSRDRQVPAISANGAASASAAAEARAEVVNHWRIGEHRVPGTHISATASSSSSSSNAAPGAPLAATGRHAPPDAATRGCQKACVINNDFCEVCQKGGKLLFCETCPRAFHAQCIDQVVDVESVAQSDVWSCPICLHGEGALQGQSRLQMSENEMEAQMIAKARRNKSQYSAAKRRRDFFLIRHLPSVGSFLSRTAEKRLTKIANDPTMPPLQIGARVQARDSKRGVFQAVVLSHSGQRYIIADMETGQEALVERERLVDLDLSSVTADFLSHARRPIVSDGTRLKDYQAAGVNWLIHGFYNRCGGILADDMGLGKTIQTLAMLSWIHSSRVVEGPFLVVAPLSCAGNWVREAKRFVPHMSVAKVTGSAAEREYALDNDEIWYGVKDIIVTTYDTIKSMEDYFCERHFWSVVVLDEAHRIKGQFTQTRTVLDNIQCASRVLLTGTPLQNNLGELFELLRFLWPDVFAVESEEFLSAVQLPVNLWNNMGSNSEADPASVDDIVSDSVVNMSTVEKIRSVLSVVMLRRRKEEAIALPPKVIRDVWLPLTPCQVFWYKALLDFNNQRFQFSRGTRALYKLLLRLRLVCGHPRCMVTNEASRKKFFNECPTLDHKALTKLLEAPMSNEVIAQSGKLSFLDKLLGHLHAQNMGFSTEWRKGFEERSKKGPLAKASKRSASQWLKGLDDTTLFLDEMRPWKKASEHSTKETDEGCDGELDTPKPHKVLIFGQFQNSLDILQEFCNFRGWRNLRLDGSTSRVLRELDMRDFNCHDEDYFVYLIGTRAGGLGINLASANHVVLFDQDWNPHVDHQAIDRAHRIGQYRKVTIYRLIQEWGVEEKLLHRQEQKLKMENLMIHQGGVSEQCGDDDDHSSVKERLSADDVIMLVRYGEDTLKHFAGETFDDKTLRVLLERNRQPLMTKDQLQLNQESTALPEHLRGSVIEDDGDGEATVIEGANGKDHSHQALKPLSTQATPELPPGSIRSASGRIIKLVQHFPLPEEPRRQQKPREPLRHFHMCFVCDPGLSAKLTSKEDVEHAEPCDLLCDSCPKAFHSKCLVGNGTMAGKYVSKNRWVCGWHFCASCRRSSATCGGMLIQCLKCPTALCYDCFPPNFRRVHPPQRFWADLTSKGYKADPEKMAFFACNACRALEEQQRRMKMRREDLEAQQDEKKRAALEEKRSFQDRQKRKEDEEARRRMRQVMLEHERKGLQDNLDSAKAEVADALELLWPPQFRRRWLAHLKAQRMGARAKILDKNSTVKACLGCGFPGHRQQECMLTPEKIISKRETAAANSPEGDDNGVEEKNADKEDKASESSKKKSISYVRVCSNCQRSGHGRLQCPNLSAEQRSEYEKRINDLRRVAAGLGQTKPPEEPFDESIADVSAGRPDFCLQMYSSVQDAVHLKVRDVLWKCNLEELIAEPPALPLPAPKPKAEGKARGKVRPSDDPLASRTQGVAYIKALRGKKAGVAPQAQNKGRGKGLLRSRVGGFSAVMKARLREKLSKPATGSHDSIRLKDTGITACRNLILDGSLAGWLAHGFVGQANRHVRMRPVGEDAFQKYEEVIRNASKKRLHDFETAKETVLRIMETADGIKCSRHAQRPSPNISGEAEAQVVGVPPAEPSDVKPKGRGRAKGRGRSRVPAERAPEASDEWSGPHFHEGKPFWHNSRTGESSWEAPDAASKQATSVASSPAFQPFAARVQPVAQVTAKKRKPDGEAESDWSGPYLHDGSPFWHNQRTGESSWTPPPGEERQATTVGSGISTGDSVPATAAQASTKDGVVHEESPKRLKVKQKPPPTMSSGAESAEMSPTGRIVSSRGRVIKMRTTCLSAAKQAEMRKKAKLEAQEKASSEQVQ